MLLLLYLNIKIKALTRHVAYVNMDCSSYFSPNFSKLHIKPKQY